VRKYVYGCVYLVSCSGVRLWRFEWMQYSWFNCLLGRSPKTSKHSSEQWKSSGNGFISLIADGLVHLTGCLLGLQNCGPKWRRSSADGIWKPNQHRNEVAMVPPTIYWCEGRGHSIKLVQFGYGYGAKFQVCHQSNNFTRRSSHTYVVLYR